MSDSTQGQTVATFTEVSLRVPHGQSELVCDFIIAQHFSSGLVLGEEEGDDAVEVRFYVTPEEAKRFSREFPLFYRQTFASPSPETRTRGVQSFDWEERYRQSVTPQWIGATVLVRPTWARPLDGAQYPDVTEIIIDPKMAFGTGTHETTRLCLAALDREEVRGARVADIGCGSLILSILAAKKGAAHVEAVDNDPIAVENSLENRALNNVEDKITVRLGSIETISGEDQFNILIANIIRETIVALFPQFLAVLRPGGVLILSGLLVPDGPEIERLFARNDIADWRRDIDGEWLCYRAVRPR